MRSYHIFTALLFITAAVPSNADDLLVTISEETTRITSPLKPDGYPDYVAALNLQLQKGVTPDNNLAVGLWKISGPIDLSVEMKPHFFNALGMDDLPFEGDYLTDYYTHYSEYLGPFNPQGGISLEDYESSRNDYEDAYSESLSAPWTKVSHPQVFQWREDNLDHIEAILKAVDQRDQYFNPYVLMPGSRDNEDDFAPEIISILLPGVQRSRELARTLTIDAYYHLGNGDLDSAMRNSIAVQKMGRLIAKGGTLVEGLVGIAINGIAYTLDKQIIASEDLSATQLKAHLNNIQSLSKVPSLVEKINVTERYMYLDTTIAVAQHGPSALNITTGSAANPNPLTKGLGKLFASSFVNWDNVLKTGNYWYDEMYRISKIQDIAKRNQAYSDLDNRLSTLATEANDPASLAKKVLLSGKTIPEITSEQMSNIMVSLLLPALSAAVSAQERGLMQHEITQVAIGLELYHHANNRYPSNLDALKGTFLKSLPNDRFSGKPLKYKTTGNGYLLYSFGRDHEDNNGQTFDDEPAGDDIAIKRAG